MMNDRRRTILSSGPDCQREGRRAKKNSCSNSPEGRRQPGRGWLERPANCGSLRRGPLHGGARAPALRQGLEAALVRKPQQNRIPRKLDGVAEAQLISVACSKHPRPSCKKSPSTSWPLYSPDRPCNHSGSARSGDVAHDGRRRQGDQRERFRTMEERAHRPSVSRMPFRPAHPALR